MGKSHELNEFEHSKEHLWHELKQRRSKRTVHPRNSRELEEILQEEFHLKPILNL
ncbi:9816_t:CDS:2 [Ambispora leptoticha]|uniref:9816_t:CDS:1 n=1 Tax=Ambispora leptoticha TaxID=144679 RepID=A0A9N9FM58_9GLOM|nr:9816_t:CDS:2 [Ambispora leptoticha]